MAGSTPFAGSGARGASDFDARDAAAPEADAAGAPDARDASAAADARDADAPEALAAGTPHARDTASTTARDAPGSADAPSSYSAADARDDFAASASASDEVPGAPRRSRPRDSQATKGLLLSAARAEFAEFGLAGARIDRIADRAGANKRLLYVYFGDKEQLFAAVLEREIGALAQATPLLAGDLVGYAAARFDHMLAHPETARLAAWRRFEEAPASASEIEGYQKKVEAVAKAQREGRLDDSIPAVDLFALVLRMTESWLDAPPALKAAAGADQGSDARSDERLAQHRAALIEAVRRVVAPRPAADRGAGKC